MSTSQNNFEKYKMDKDFLENCRLLKKHYTQLTRADTSAQSDYKELKPNVANNIISEAKQLLLNEQIEALSDKDIEKLRQKSVIKYANSLEKHVLPKQSCRKSLCQNKICWDDENFWSNLPHPKSNQISSKTNLYSITENANEEKLENKENDKKKDTKEETLARVQEKVSRWRIRDKNGGHENEFSNGRISKNEIRSRKELTDLLLNDDKIEERTVNIRINTSVPSTDSFLEIEIEQIVPEKNVQEKEVIKEIPELQIIPQKTTKIDNFLEVKKLQKEESFDEVAKEIVQTNQQRIIKQVFTKWRAYVRSLKTKPKKCEQSIKKIENFLETLQKLKNKSKSDLTSKNLVKDGLKIKPKSSSSLETKVSSFENRFKAQKGIIEMQKIKLEEQKRLIEELKLNKIQKAVAESLDNAQNELKNITLTSKSKIRVNIDQKALPNVPENDNKDPFGVNVTLNLSKAPKLVQCMEQRAKEREERREMIKERKRVLDEEKKRLAEEAVRRKLEEELVEKQQRLEKLKQQRDLVRQLELKKQLEKKKFIELNIVAQRFYKIKLVRFVVERFKMLLYNVRIKAEVARRFYEHNLVFKLFKKWKIHTNNVIKEKNERADEHYKKKLKQKCMTAWKNEHMDYVRSKQVAEDRYEMSLIQKHFISWHRLVCEIHIKNRINYMKAEKYYRRLLLFQCLNAWRSFPAIMEEARIQNERKRKWRMKVAEVLPDYNPNKNYE